MYAALAADGELDGERLLSPETLRRATEIQSRDRGRVIPLRMHWRLGYHRVFGIRARFDDAFGHFGYGGSGAFADPRRNLSAALVLNSGVGTPFGDTRVARIASAAARCADRR
jgi:CubicO group peptidase (beta-lactamase class C family)